MKFVIASITYFFITMSVAGQYKKVNSEEYCHLASREYPETFIQIKTIRDNVYFRGILFHKGNPIRALWFTQSNGYGIKWWGYDEDKEYYGGKRGGRLLEFRGNIPLRSFPHHVQSNSKRKIDRQFILIGLGGDLYYEQKKTDSGYKFPWREDGFELIKAAEGYFSVEEGCKQFLNR